MNTFKRFIHKWAWLFLIAYCIVGVIYPFVGAAALVCMLAPVIVAFFKGRLWCGNFCPRGSFNDIILSKISLKRNVPKFIKTTWFKNLFLIVLMSAFAVQLVFAWGSAVAVGQVFLRMIIITTVITIILGISYSHRTWCMICPMGTMAHYVAKMEQVKSRIAHITFNKEKCVNCKICTKKCPLGIDVLAYKTDGKVDNAECMKCNVCVDACPKKALFIE